MKKINLKKWFAVAVVGVMAGVMMTGCGKDEIVMGTNAAFPPFESIEGGEVVGFDVEIAKLVANKLGKELVIEDMEFGTLLAAVNTGKVDFVAAGMTATEERAKQVDFSDKYFNSKQVIIVNDGDTAITGPDDLVGKKVGVQLGTTGDLFASGTEGVDVIRFDKAALAVMDLKNNKLSAVIVDEEPAKKIAANQTGVTLLEAPFIEEEYAIAVKKGNEDLLKEINQVLADMKADGTYDKLYEQYFGKAE
ncbi:MAG: basic amino acid ABC transporter substrate-binding protein [Cellulosilyticaceae bacterium]